MTTCVGCGESVIQGARFCSVCGRGVTFSAPPPPQTSLMYKVGSHGLVRPREGRMVAGVCAGFALRYGWDISIVRLVVLLSVLVAGAPVIAYLIAWVVMPNAQLTLPAQVTPGGPSSMGM